MNTSIFRKSSIDRVSSPEQLTDYIKVPSPGVWAILAAIIILLAGVCVWGVFGKMDTVLSVAAISDGDSFYCLVKEADAGRVTAGMTVKADGNEYTVSSVSSEPVSVSREYGDYVMHVGGLELGEWAYKAYLSGAPASGVYSGRITVESVTPISFVLN